MRKAATEGDIRLRRGTRIKRKDTKQGFVLKSRARRLPILECEGGGGGRGLFIYTADEYPLAHIDSGTFFL